MIRWLEELIAAIQTGSGGVNVRKKTQVYLLLHLTLCLSDPPRVVRGHRVVHSGHFWVSSQKATCSESHQPKGPLYPNKKNNLCYVTHWCCCCCLWQWSRRRKPEGGGGSDARWKWLGQRVEGKGEEKREEVVLDDSLLPTSCTVTISVLCVLSSCSPFTVTQRPHSLQQHDITDYSHHLIKPHWWKWCSCFSDSYTYACSCSPAPLWLGFMCLMCRCYF